MRGRRTNAWLKRGKQAGSAGSEAGEQPGRRAHVLKANEAWEMSPNRISPAK